MADKVKGTVKFYNSTKGFGFVTTEEGSVEVFFHVSNLGTIDSDRLEKGQSLLFNTIKGKKGLEAINIEQDSN